MIRNVLFFFYTTKTGIATAYGPNSSELSAPKWDETSIKFLDILRCNFGNTTIQHSSEKFQVGMDTVQIYRALWQMKQNQWFEKYNDQADPTSAIYIKP